MFSIKNLITVSNVYNTSSYRLLKIDNDVLIVIINGAGSQRGRQ